MNPHRIKEWLKKYGLQDATANWKLALKRVNDGKKKGKDREKILAWCMNNDIALEAQKIEEVKKREKEKKAEKENLELEMAEGFRKIGISVFDNKAAENLQPIPTKLSDGTEKDTKKQTKKKKSANVAKESAPIELSYSEIAKLKEDLSYVPFKEAEKILKTYGYTLERFQAEYGTIQRESTISANLLADETEKFAEKHPKKKESENVSDESAPMELSGEQVSDIKEILRHYNLEEGEDFKRAEQVLKSLYGHSLKSFQEKYGPIQEESTISANLSADETEKSAKKQAKKKKTGKVSKELAPMELTNEQIYLTKKILRSLNLEEAEKFIGTYGYTLESFQDKYNTFLTLSEDFD